MIHNLKTQLHNSFITFLELNYKYKKHFNQKNFLNILSKDNFLNEIMNQNENYSKDYVYIIYNLLNICQNKNLDDFKKKILRYYLKQNLKFNQIKN